MMVTAVAVMGGFTALVTTYVFRYAHGRRNTLRIARKMIQARSSADAGQSSCEDCHGKRDKISPAP